MPVDINMLRVDRGGDPEAVRASEKRRCRSGSIIDKVLALDNEWRKVQYDFEQLKKDQNSMNKDIASKKKAKEDVTELIAKSTELKKQIPEMEALAEQKQKERDSLLHKIGNIVPEEVPATADEDQNEIVRVWGIIDKDFKIDGTPGHLAHYEILEKLDGFNLKKGTEVAGHRGYYLMGYGCMLNQALVQYGLSFLRRKGYLDVQPPFFMKREVMASTAELADFAETLYRIPASEDTEAKEDAKREDLFLIATSEQPISALHMNEYLDRELPLRYAGVSTCFRKEAGSHGKDMRGIFRVHQFEKVEQFVLCSPKDSKMHHEQMIGVSEEFLQSLNLPYRTIIVVAGAMNDTAAKKYDVEAWFPSYEAHRELVSCSNCTDFQARGLNVRHGAPKMGEREKPFVHMLNGTLCAAERTMCCLLEHYQTPDGVKVPRVLQPYMDGLTFLPFKATVASSTPATAT